ncbi:MAG: hypothetical protein NC131_15010 [Roseburia sp.]|nr:hypothetical protein [Roseburia sp.]
MRNKELLQVICNNLNNEGFSEMDSGDLLAVKQIPFTVKSPAISQLDWLPYENLEEMSEMDISKYRSFADIYQEWGRQGLLKFKPYMVWNSDKVALTLRHNKFLTMHGLQYYQLSSDPDGKSECSLPSTRISGIMCLIDKDIKVWSQSRLMFMLLYANMIDAGFQCDSFADQFYNDRVTINQFFMESMKLYSVDFGMGCPTFEDLITYEDTSLLDPKCYMKGVPIYEVRVKNNIACRFRMSQYEVEVEYNPSNVGGLRSTVARLNIPAPLDGVLFGNTSDDRLRHYYDDFESAMSNYEYMFVQKALTLMMLKFVGVHIGKNSYLLRKIGFIAPSWSNEYIVAVSKYTDIISKEVK